MFRACPLYYAIPCKEHSCYRKVAGKPVSKTGDAGRKKRQKGVSYLYFVLCTPLKNLSCYKKVAGKLVGKAGDAGRK